MSRSPAEALAALGPEEWDRHLAELSEEGAKALLTDWRFWARDTQRPPDGPWRWFVFMGGRGAGKLLALSTLIPTPSGFVELGTLGVGDEVFDEMGRVGRVTAVHDAVPERAWMLWFSDGEVVTAGGEHQWVTWTNADRKAWNRSIRRTGPLPDDWPTWRAKDRWGNETALGPACRTTDEVVATVRYGRRGDTNHSIPTTGPLQLPDADLSVDPYVLGFWLGDGSSAESSVTIGHQDEAEILGSVRAAGYSVGKPRSKAGSACTTWPIGSAPPQRDAATGQMRPNGGLRSVLRALGVFRNKHVPDAYLWSSEYQRLELLRGLMDSDGCNAHSTVEFMSTNVALASAVRHLARSLGERPVMAKGRAALYGVDCGPRWRVTWAPARHNPFHLTRKANAVRGPGAQGSRRFHRMIVAAEAVAVQPMRCLSVDSPNHMYLVGEALIPTHNTRAGAEWICDRAEAFAKAGVPHKVGLLERTYDDVRAVQIEGESGLVPVAERRGHKLWHPATSLHARLMVGEHVSEIEIHTAKEPDRVRGRNFHTLWLEELSAWSHKVDKSGNTAFTNADLGLRALCPSGMHPQGMVTMTPKPIKPVKDLVAGKFGPIVLRTSSLFDNLSNLDPQFVETILSHYARSRLGPQEIEGKLIDAVEGALWTPASIHETRLELVEGVSLPDMMRVVIGVDPPGETTTECGIVIDGVAFGAAQRLHLYIMDDWSLAGPPETWGRRVIDAYYAFNADAVAAEVNHGHDMVRAVIHLQDANVNLKKVYASRGKYLRAEPVSSLWGVDQLRGHIVGYLGGLESEMTTWVQGDDSPNRLDAMVHGAADLIPDLAVVPSTVAYGRTVANARIGG